MNIYIEILISVASGTSGAWIGWKILENSITAKIAAKIKHSYDLKLENYRSELLIKQKAALIAELISEWASNPEDKKQLNKLSFEAFIWLPKDIAAKLTLRLTNDPNSPNAKDIIADVRTLLLGKNESISGESIVHF